MMRPLGKCSPGFAATHRKEQAMTPTQTMPPRAPAPPATPFGLLFLALHESRQRQASCVLRAHSELLGAEFLQAAVAERDSAGSLATAGPERGRPVEASHEPASPRGESRLQKVPLAALVQRLRAMLG